LPDHHSPIPAAHAPTASPPTATAELAPEIRHALDQFAALYPFPLDDFQRDAIATLLRGDSVMVAAPTGSGKTVVAEFGIYDAFKRTGRVFYTAPIKALSNQKFRDLRAIYGDEVGLLTGDVSENRDARIIVMTTEILRNMLLQSPWELDDVETVIFDEIHYLADPERGTTWEESIILCPDHIQLICLSATVTNASEISGWIGRTHRPIRLIVHNERPVPLALYYFHDDALTEVVDHHGRHVADFSSVGGEARRRPAGRNGRRRAEREREASDEPQPHEIVDELEGQNLLPAIYFLFSRNDCQAYAERLAMMRPHMVTPDRAAQIEHVLAQYLASIPATRAQGYRLPPRRVVAGAEAVGRGALQPRPDASCLRHRHARARRQHAGANGRDRPHDEVGRAPPARADPKRVPADGGARGTPRHGRLRPRRHPLLAVDTIPRCDGGGDR
jgi:superfamily II RNA helicase